MIFPKVEASSSLGGFFLRRVRVQNFEVIVYIANFALGPQIYCFAKKIRSISLHCM